MKILHFMYLLPKSGAILSSSWRSLSFEVVANKVFCWSCGYSPHVCWNRHRWTDRNAAQFSGFTQSLCICNNMKCGRNQHKSYCSKIGGNNSEILGMERAVAAICMSCLVRAKESTVNMVTEYGSWWLLWLHKWLPSIFLSGPIESPA